MQHKNSTSILKRARKIKKSNESGEAKVQHLYKVTGNCVKHRTQTETVENTISRHICVCIFYNILQSKTKISDTMAFKALSGRCHFTLNR